MTFDKIEMKLLIWDFDGTLAYREGMWTGALCGILQDHVPEFAIRRDVLRAALQTGFPWHTPDRSHLHLESADRWWDAIRPVFVRAFLAAGVDEERSALLAAHVRSKYCDIRQWSVFPDVHDTLSRLSNEGWQHVILSNHIPELGEIVRDLHLDQFFIRIVSSAASGYEKPNPMAYASAIEGFSDVEDLWMIGDSMTADIRGAERYGWKTILVRRFDSEARYASESLFDIVKILNGSEPQPDGGEKLQPGRKVPLSGGPDETPDPPKESRDPQANTSDGHSVDA